MHGGAAGSGAPTGARNGNYRHGRYTKEIAATRRWLRKAAHMLRELNKGSDNNRNYESLTRPWRCAGGHCQKRAVYHGPIVLETV